MNIAIINGPNLNLLGQREPGIYGQQSFDDFYQKLCKDFPEVSFTYFQSNVEGESRKPCSCFISRGMPEIQGIPRAKFRR